MIFMKVPCCVCVVLISIATLGQTKTFVGNWSLDNLESISGKFYQNGVPEKVGISDGKEFYILEKSTRSSGKTTTSKDSLSLNHPVISNTEAGRKKTVTTKKSDDGAFETTTHLFSPSNENVLEYISVDRWMLEKDKLILVRKLSNQLNGEEWEMQATYTKDSK